MYKVTEKNIEKRLDQVGPDTGAKRDSIGTRPPVSAEEEMDQIIGFARGLVAALPGALFREPREPRPVATAEEQRERDRDARLSDMAFVAQYQDEGDAP
jgi:hypothetical protein